MSNEITRIAQGVVVAGSAVAAAYFWQNEDGLRAAIAGIGSAAFAIEAIAGNPIVSIFESLADRVSAPFVKQLCICFRGLRTPPNLQQYPRLQHLDLSNNNLIVPPDVRHNSLLEQLTLHGNSLTTSPDITQNLELQSLNLNSNRLVNPPNVSQNRKLQILHVRFNSFTTPPDVSQNPQLKTLNMSCTDDLTTPPDVSQNPQLKTLSLSYTGLIVPPNVSQNPRLKTLSLDMNRLTTCPDLSQNALLKKVNLEHNQLTELHDSILDLPRACVIYAENNLFTAEYVERFQARLRARRREDPTRGPTVYMSIHGDSEQGGTTTLEQTLQAWANECKNVDVSAFKPLLELEPRQQVLLHRFLNKLRGTRDYKTPVAKPGLIQNVGRVLQLACTDSDFREVLLQRAEEGSTSCDDRTILLFNKLEIEWRIRQPKAAEEQRKLLVCAARSEWLENYAREIARENQLGDEIETILYYQWKLRDALQLPFSMQGMLYSGASGVTEEMVSAAKNAIARVGEAELLSQSFFYQKHGPKTRSSGKDEQPITEEERIDVEFRKLLEDAEEYYSLENAEAQKQHLQEKPRLAEFLQQKGTTDASATAKAISEERQRQIHAARARSIRAASSSSSVTDFQIKNITIHKIGRF